MTGSTAAPEPGSTPGQEPTLGALTNQLTTQIPELIRSEIRLAQAELTQKGKQAGTGAGMFGAAGLLALYGLAALFATAIIALGEAGLPWWLAALIVTVVIFALAGIIALVGKSKVSKAGPMKPERAMEGMQEDIATVKGQHK